MIDLVKRLLVLEGKTGGADDEKSGHGSLRPPPRDGSRRRRASEDRLDPQGQHGLVVSEIESVTKAAEDETRESIDLRRVTNLVNRHFSE